MIYYLLSIFWFIRQSKAGLFWLYLWQLKEYHLGRFADHFRTERGKSIFFNFLFLFKAFLLLYLLKVMRENLFILYALLGLYLAEAIWAFKNFFQKKLLKPVFTPKTVFLTLAIFILQALFFIFTFTPNYRFLIAILLFDVFTPAIISGVVLLFQPLIVLWRWRMIKAAIKKREGLKKLLVIGITGSYGKTSTKEFLATILEEKFKVLKTKEHQNSEIGISQCILNDLKPGHEVFIVEMGAYNRGGIKLLSDIVKPKIGILTGINEQHMALFGSENNIVRAKYELIQNLPRRDGLAVFNGDNFHCFKLYRRTLLPKKVYSLQSTIYEYPVDIWAKNIKVKKDSLDFRVEREDEQADFKVNLLGAHNILNILGAVLLAKELGMSLQEIARACQKIKPTQGAAKLLKGKNNLKIIDSTYSANPDGVISHLEYLKIWPSKKVIVMPCLIELGSSSVKVHKKIGRKIGEVCNLAIITTKERFREIKGGAIEKGMEKENILFIEKEKEILAKIKSFTKRGDVILLEGRVPKKLINQLIEK
jgi:UDP-N-acetylmuramoyl-tripeptide--D-alanyl-D-alanine ligase